MSTMKATVSCLLVMCAIGAAAGAQSDAVQAHVAAAKAAAGSDFAGVFSRICTEAVPPATPAPQRGRGPAAPRPAGPPARETWHAEPVKVFDNLYFLGQTEYSVWAVTTSAGVILIDSIFDYSVDDEVVGGMKKLGLDPATIKYVIISHGHSDHSGGAGSSFRRANGRQWIDFGTDIGSELDRRAGDGRSGSSRFCHKAQSILDVAGGGRFGFCWCYLRKIYAIRLEAKGSTREKGGGA